MSSRFLPTWVFKFSNTSCNPFAWLAGGEIQARADPLRSMDGQTGQFFIQRRLDVTELYAFHGVLIFDYQLLVVKPPIKSMGRNQTHR